MANKWIALATAIVVAVPIIASAEDPGMTLLNLLADVYGSGKVGPIDDSVGIEGNRTQVLVSEGHNVFVVIEIERDQVNKTKVNLTGFIECRYTAEVDPVPNPIEIVRSLYASFSVRCRAGDTVVLYPSQAPTPSQSSLVPTGVEALAVAPDGSAAIAYEYAYLAPSVLPDGTLSVDSYPAWTVGLASPRTDDVTGKRYNFVAPDIATAFASVGSPGAKAALLSVLPS